MEFIAKLITHYVVDAWPFFALHILLLLYFLYRSLRSWRYLNQDLEELRDDTNAAPALFGNAEEKIKKYDGIGRIFYIRDLEESILEKGYRNTEPLRLLGSSFIAVGLLGTLFALFSVGTQISEPGSNSNAPANVQANTQMNRPGNQQTAPQTDQIIPAANPQPSQQKINPTDKNKELVTRMSIAFSSSFFGLFWTLLCSMFLLRPLRTKVSLVSSEVRKRIVFLVEKYPVNTPEQSLTEAVKEMKNYAEGFNEVVGRMETATQEHSKTSTDLLTNFTTTTESMLLDLSGSVSKSGEEMKASAESLESKVTESLKRLETTFKDISANLQDDLEMTIKSSTDAATRLSESSQRLSETSLEVSGSLKDVKDALENTKHLSEITEKVKEVTLEYSQQMHTQVNAFEGNLEKIVSENKKMLMDMSEAISRVPDAWGDELNRRHEELARNLQNIADNWEKEVLEVNQNFFTEYQKMGSTMTDLSKIFAPGAVFSDAIRYLPQIIDDARKAADTHHTYLEGVITRLAEAVSGLVSAIRTLPINNDGLLRDLERQAGETQELLRNLLEKPATVEPDISSRKGKTKGGGKSVGTGKASKPPADGDKRLPSSAPAEIPKNNDITEPVLPAGTLSQSTEPAVQPPPEVVERSLKTPDEPAALSGNGQPRVIEPDANIDPEPHKETSNINIPPVRPLIKDAIVPGKKTGFIQGVKNRWNSFFGSKTEAAPDSDETKPE